jgi:hypothetical protein
MRDTFEKLKNISLQFGLIVNGNKMKYLKCKSKETQLERLTVGNIGIDQIRSFTYLGTIVNGNKHWKKKLEKNF